MKIPLREIVGIEVNVPVGTVFADRQTDRWILDCGHTKLQTARNKTGGKTWCYVCLREKADKNGG